MTAFPLLLEPGELASHLPLTGNVLIIEQAGRDNFLQGHIPGSVWLDFRRLQAGTAPAPGALPSMQQLSQVFSELGLTPDTHVICSDDEGGGWAGRLIWVLDCLGHKHYSYLNGGLVAWRADGLPQQTTENTPAPSGYTAQLVNSACSLTKEKIQQRLGQPGFAIWDARSAAEYRGEKVVSARGGHIPGAVNYEWTLGMDKERGLRINNLHEFRALLKTLGIDDSKEIVTHCQTHHRSGFTYLVGKILGLNIKGYAGSWAEWGNAPDTPVNTGNHP